MLFEYFQIVKRGVSSHGVLGGSGADLLPVIWSSCMAHSIFQTNLSAMETSSAMNPTNATTVKSGHRTLIWSPSTCGKLDGAPHDPIYLYLQ